MSEKCGRCGKTVYEAEKVLSAGRKWHDSCFRCKSCGTRLESTTVRDRDGEIFCFACYGKAFGPKGYGFGGGAGTLNNTGVVPDGSETTTPVFSTTSSTSSSPAPSTSEEEKSTTEGGCPSCGTPVTGAGKFCSNCGFVLGGESSQAKPIAPPPTTTTTSSTPSSSGLSSVSSAPARPRPSGGGGGGFKFGATNEKCHRCGKTVYAAEKEMAAGSHWHHSCFRCLDCGKGLDSTTVRDRDGEIYCAACYGKKFGPKGYGYGTGAGTLGHTK